MSNWTCKGGCEHEIENWHYNGCLGRIYLLTQLKIIGKNPILYVKENEAKKKTVTNLLISSS